MITNTRIEELAREAVNIVHRSGGSESLHAHAGLTAEIFQALVRNEHEATLCQHYRVDYCSTCDEAKVPA